MCVHLVILSQDGAERSIAVDRERAVIGRETRCDVRVPLPSVDPHHCELIQANGIIELKDLDSESGTYCNGDRIESTILSDRDRISMGSFTFEVRFGE